MSAVAVDEQGADELLVADGSPGLRLPLAAVTETFAIIGRRGSGKTSTGVVLAEEMIAAGLPVVVLDPLGVWWGLRADASGTGDGLPVVIFGGEHADVPLDAGTGALVADVVVDERPPAVLDLSGLSKAGTRRWAADFLEQLYRRNRRALHVFVDEADAFAPQRTTGEGARLLGAMEDLVRRGRVRGLGATMITQRPAVLNKDVLTQAEVLVALQLTGPTDVKAVDEWVRQHGDEQTAAQVKASLPSLTRGQSWWWSPAWLDILQQVTVRPRWTFDSSATPRAGEFRPVAERMAAVDLAAITDRMAEVVERAAVDDPAVLWARIAELQDAARDRPVPAPERVEVPVFTDEQVAELVLQVTAARSAGTALVEAATRMERMLAGRAPGPVPVPDPPSVPSEPPALPSDAPATETAPEAAKPLPRAQAVLLAVLVRHGTMSAQRLAVLSGYSVKSSSFEKAIGALRSGGLAEGGRTAISATAAGRDVAGDLPPLPTGRALVEHWLGQLPLAQRTLLGCLLDAYPAALSAGELAQASGYSRTSSSFEKAIGRLRTLELAHGRSDAITADDELGKAYADE